MKDNSATTEVLTTAEVAERFRVGQRTVYRWLESGKLEGFQTPGGHWRIKVDSVMALFQKMVKSEPLP